ncbi:MAG TPA: secretin N-terminal domain-containing protein [Burkholderiales bacterium]|nr:secretin N-terminal domain-containing protein [Burkholderiales bacterium]
MNRRNTAASAIIAVLLAGCGQIPLKPASTHLSAADVPSAEGQIPPPVQAVPVLPRPEPTTPPETYSVVVNNVDVHDLLFALARDAKVNVDIEPGITGKVTLNAIDQTLPQLLTRIGRQVDMRYELHGPDLVVMRDTPYLHVYRVDYVNLTRDAKSVANLSTQVSGNATGTGGGAASSGENNSTSTITSDSNNKFWDTLIANIKDLLRETDKVLPTSAPTPAAQQAPAAAGQPQAAAKAPAPSAAPATFREAASVIANPEAGILSIRATSRQHARIQEFLDQVMASARRQVLIEATIAEVQLNNQYQRGIDWSKLSTGSAGFTFRQSSAATPAGINTSAFTVGYASLNNSFTSAVKLLESFGSVRVLSSPKLSVLNNQTAVLKVVDNLVYFTIQANTTTPTQGPVQTTFTTTVNSVPVGFIMSVVPQISAADAVLLNVRPTISRKLTDVADPNPALANPCGVGVNNCSTPSISSLIPVIQTREMESVLRVQSGQIAVLGGLMQDTVNNIEDTVPGLNRIPGVGSLFEQRNDLNQKTELVIFLRATVLNDPSLSGDLRDFRSLLPGPDYFSKPNPSRPAVGE